MKPSSLSRLQRHLSSAVRASVIAASWAGALACSSPQRFESAMKDQPAAGDEGEDSEQPPEDETTLAGTVSPPSSTAAPLSETASEPTPLHSADAAAAPLPSGTASSLPDGTSDWLTEANVSSEASAPAASASAGPDDLTEPSVPSDTAPLGTSSGVQDSHDPTASSHDVSSAPPPVDECPEHDDQLLAGNCGCGHEPSPACDSLRSAISHRYSFVSHAMAVGYDPETIPDSVGSADGTIHDGEFDWDGSLRLDGQNSYVELPARLLSGNDETTVDLWVKWWGGEDNQRLLNFGQAPNTASGTPDNFLSISPSGSDGVLTVQYRTDGDERADKLRADTPLQTSDLQHITLVIRQQSLALFVNGRLEVDAETPHRLEDLKDDDNWLGRALYSSYPLYHGALFEFRVFERALTDDEVALVDDLGLALP